jgi:hypothetical protein
MQKGLRDRNSPSCTLSQNGYGASGSGQTPLASTHAPAPTTWVPAPRATTESVSARGLGGVLSHRNASLCSHGPCARPSGAAVGCIRHSGSCQDCLVQAPQHEPTNCPSWSMFLGQQQQMRWPATPRLLRAAVAHKVQVHSAELMAFATTLLWVYPVQRQPAQTFRSHCRRQLCQLCWAEAPIKIARMTLTIKLDRNWSSFQLANSAPPLSVTDSAIAPSARMLPHLRAARW